MARRVALILAFCGLAHASAFQDRVDWSGTWISDGHRVSIVRNEHHTGHGWEQTAENLTAASTYSIVVSATAESIAIDFPGGGKNILTVPRFSIGTSPQVLVDSHGDWWTKNVLSGRWVGRDLELTIVTFTGWWKNGPPDQARPSPTDFKRRIRLSAGADPDELWLDVALADEKGELDYVQTFRRQR